MVYSRPLHSTSPFKFRNFKEANHKDFRGYKEYASYPYSGYQTAPKFHKIPVLLPYHTTAYFGRSNNRNNHVVSKSWGPPRSSMGVSPFVRKYALKRSKTDGTDKNISLNRILGRRVGNLSKSKYRFVNAKLRAKVKSQTNMFSYMMMQKKYLQYPLNQSALTLRKQHLASRLVVRSTKLLQTKKSNKFCLFFNKFGKCHRGTNCADIHDPDKISICTRYLRGTCNVSGCLFSHKISTEKMPTCRYFLKGLCIKTDCPYNHVNVGKDAVVCKSFLNGHCPLGDKCKQKHVYLCPEYSRKGSCSLANSCPMRHVPKKEAAFGKPSESRNNLLQAPKILPNLGGKTTRLKRVEGVTTSFISINDSIDDRSDSRDAASVFSDVGSWSIFPSIGSK